jgi:hypothetical protein
MPPDVELDVAKTVLHLKTQRNQPYGSERRSCERCGVMIWMAPVPPWTDDEDVYKNPPEGYERCEDAMQRMRDAEAYEKYGKAKA